MIVSPVFLFKPYPVALHVEERGLLIRKELILESSQSLIKLAYLIIAPPSHLKIQANCVCAKGFL